MIFRKITSRSNPRIADAASLPKTDRDAGRVSFLIEGTRLVEMGLSSDASLSAVFFTEEFGRRREHLKLLRLLNDRTGQVFQVAERVFRKLAATETPQGIAAIASVQTGRIEDFSFGKSPLIIAVDGIQDPGNLGTIVRTADAAGADAVVMLPGTCDVFSPKTVRATAGSIFHIPVVPAEQTSLAQWAVNNGISFAVTAVDSGISLFDADLAQPLILVFGNEAHGVSLPMRASAGFLLKIPIVGRAESLNVATSAAVCLYEAVRQRTFAGR